MGDLINRLKGKLKQVEGAITGNRRKQAEGVVDETKAKMKGKVEDIKRDLKK